MQNEKIKIQKTNLLPKTDKRKILVELNLNQDAYQYLTNVSLEARITVPEIITCIVENIGPDKIELEFGKEPGNNLQCEIKNNS